MFREYGKDDLKRTRKF